MQIFWMDFWYFIKKKALRANLDFQKALAERCMVRKEEIIFCGRYFISCRPNVSTTRLYNLIGMG